MNRRLTNKPKAVPAVAPMAINKSQLPRQEEGHLPVRDADGAQHAHFNEAPLEREQRVEQETQHGEHGGAGKADGEQAKQDPGAPGVFAPG